MSCQRCHRLLCVCPPLGDIVNPHVLEYVPEYPKLNPLVYVVQERCSQCGQPALETTSGVCPNCVYVNRVTASKPS
jgi:hypothetical protein